MTDHHFSIGMNGKTSDTFGPARNEFGLTAYLSVGRFKSGKSSFNCGSIYSNRFSSLIMAISNSLNSAPDNV